jgi:hypothetical protein
MKETRKRANSTLSGVRSLATNITPKLIAKSLGLAGGNGKDSPGMSEIHFDS